MQTSRFQLGLIAVLATALGFSLSSSEAVGYPAGMTIAAGSNPIVSASGHIDLVSSSTRVSSVLEAPADQDLIITDVVVGLLQNAESCRATGYLRVEDSSGIELANITVQNPYLVNASSSPVQLRLESGLRVPAGRTVDVEWNFVYRYCGFTSYDVDWVLSGYLAAP